MDGPTAPAGWYPQSDGSKRYWDGTAWADPQETADGDSVAASKPPITSGDRKAFIWIAVCVLVIGGCVWSGSRSNGDHRGPTDANVSACESAVKAQLKSPSTAEFSGHRWGDRSGGGYVLRGNVDSQNGFGAMIRSEWICEIGPGGSLAGAPVVL